MSVGFGFGVEISKAFRQIGTSARDACSPALGISLFKSNRWIRILEETTKWRGTNLYAGCWDGALPPLVGFRTECNSK
jgi:hypothetical protein